MKSYQRLPVLALIFSIIVAASPSLAEDTTDAGRLAEINTMYQDYRQDFPDIGEVSPDTLSHWINSGNVVLVDVRKPKERAVSQIPKSITQEEFEDQLDTFTDRPIVIYCTIGYRSGNFTQDLRKKGVKAFNLEGGILAWVHHEGTVEHEGATVQQVHVYGQRWSLLPAGFEAVW